MRKLLLLALSASLIPYSLFASTDTDRICDDKTLYGLINQSISVSYPGEEVDVVDVAKYFYPADTSLEVWDMRLYYVVNIHNKWKLATGNVRAELYEYNCTMRTPRFLTAFDLHRDSYVMIDHQHGGTLLLAQKSLYGATDGVTEKITAYHTPSIRRLFELKWNGKEGGVGGFVDSQKYWYLYFPIMNFSASGELYRIDKKTKKITQL